MSTDEPPTRPETPRQPPPQLYPHEPPEPPHDYRRGLIIGAIPVVAQLIAAGLVFVSGASRYGSSGTGITGFALLLSLLAIAVYLIMLLVTIGMLFSRSVRTMALGMLTSLAVGLVVIPVSCSVAINHLG